jgi:hypothetical protein
MSEEVTKQTGLWRYDPPKPLQIGRIGDEPILCDCIVCGAKGPVMAGHYGNGPRYFDAAAYRLPSGFFAAANICVNCWPQVEAYVQAHGRFSPFLREQLEKRL